MQPCSSSPGAAPAAAATKGAAGAMSWSMHLARSLLPAASSLEAGLLARRFPGPAFSMGSTLWSGPGRPSSTVASAFMPRQTVANLRQQKEAERMRKWKEGGGGQSPPPLMQPPPAPPPAQPPAPPKAPGTGLSGTNGYRPAPPPPPPPPVQQRPPATPMQQAGAGMQSRGNGTAASGPGSAPSRSPPHFSQQPSSGGPSSGGSDGQRLAGRGGSSSGAAGSSAPGQGAGQRLQQQPQGAPGAAGGGSAYAANPRAGGSGRAVAGAVSAGAGRAAPQRHIVRSTAVMAPVKKASTDRASSSGSNGGGSAVPSERLFGGEDGFEPSVNPSVVLAALQQLQEGVSGTSISSSASVQWRTNGVAAEAQWTMTEMKGAAANSSNGSTAWSGEGVQEVTGFKQPRDAMRHPASSHSPNGTSQQAAAPHTSTPPTPVHTSTPPTPVHTSTPVPGTDGGASMGQAAASISHTSSVAGSSTTAAPTSSPPRAVKLGPVSIRGSKRGSAAAAPAPAAISAPPAMPPTAPSAHPSSPAFHTGPSVSPAVLESPPAVAGSAPDAAPRASSPGPFPLQASAGTADSAQVWAPHPSRKPTVTRGRKKVTETEQLGPAVDGQVVQAGQQGAQGPPAGVLEPGAAAPKPAKRLPRELKSTAAARAARAARDAAQALAGTPAEPQQQVSMPLAAARAEGDATAAVASQGAPAPAQGAPVTASTAPAAAVAPGHGKGVKGVIMYASKPRRAKAPAAPAVPFAAQPALGQQAAQQLAQQATQPQHLEAAATDGHEQLQQQLQQDQLQLEHLQHQQQQQQAQLTMAPEEAALSSSAASPAIAEAAAFAGEAQEVQHALGAPETFTAPTPAPTPALTPEPVPVVARGAIDDVFVVDTVEAARHAVAVLLQYSQLPSTFLVPGREPRATPDTRRFFACDTEVAFIEVKEQTPVGHGAVVCFSIYGGPDINFNTDPGGPKKDRLWVDVWDEIQLDEHEQAIMEYGKVRLKDPHPIIAEFKKFFENENVNQVWHNYGFDRHVLSNMGIECRGFAGDTLHMARLLDASRRGSKTYALDSLTSDPKIMEYLQPKQAAASPKYDRRSGKALLPPPTPKQTADAMLVKKKTSMKELFGVRRLKADGTPSKVVELPPIHDIHRGLVGETPEECMATRERWIDYSALDAKATWQLREALYRCLKSRPWFIEQHLTNVMGRPEERPPGRNNFKPERTLYEFYQENWVDFGRILTDMEAAGMLVDREHLRQAQVKAEADREAAVQYFREWAMSKVPDAKYMNVASGAQIRQLFFPGHAGTITKAKKETSVLDDAFLSEADGVEEEEGVKKKKASKSKAKAKEEEVQPGTRKFKVPNPYYEEMYEEYLQAKEARIKGVPRPTKSMELTLHSVWGPECVKGMLQPEEVTATGAAPVSIKVLKGLAGKPGAARKALAALEAERQARREQEDAQKAQEAAEKVSASSADEGGAASDGGSGTSGFLEQPTLLDDDEDELLASLRPEEDEGEEGEGAAEEALVEKAEAAAPIAPPCLSRPELEAEAKAKGYGKLYATFGGGEEGLRACAAVEALCEVSAIDKLLSAFIIPLQSDNISTTDPQGRSRVHCSLNINTETGRLSARRPNLQNQPALEKDRYKVRKAFTADRSQNNTLIVADYGQLELRILAHMANCQSMIRAFVLGGDFHSRTAFGMYEHIQEAVKSGDCYLEWEGEGEPDKPLLKDKFAAERRKAKILNFSIAYGKTAHGLAKDFNTSLQEAVETVDKWYSDRHEVRSWQEQTKLRARKDASTYNVAPFVSTLLGRTRPLPDLVAGDRRKQGHAERAAINTPIQGSAADVAASAMVAISKCPELKALGFTLLMQVHDEVILEGPEENVGPAKKLVIKHMANPWAALIEQAKREGRRGEQVVAPRCIEKDDGSKLPAPTEPLLVELATDCNSAHSWYEAK